MSLCVLCAFVCVCVFVYVCVCVCVLSCADVLFFSSHKAAHLMPALFRVSANMDLNSGTDAILPVGTYTIKVCTFLMRGWSLS